ncbi:MAG: FAD:protein FMN transferase [Kiritimatiellae bacterium]|nr:FAD:protein FMN transferase [Kiritimatiellia bacterium]
MSRRVQWPEMGTVAAVQSPQREMSYRAKEVCTAVYTEADAVFSTWRTDSELARVNGYAGTNDVIHLSPSLDRLLRSAFALCRESGGAFNPLLGPVMEAWGFNGADPVTTEPSAATLQAALARAEWRDVTFPVPGGIRLPRAGLKLDLGGIAKGSCVDAAYAALEKAAFRNVLIDLGGNLRALEGSAFGRDGWKTAVRDPFGKVSFAGSFLLRGGEAAASSGNYERFVVIKGVRYAHIMDGRTGRPVRGMAATTVVAPTAEEADGLSTVLFVLGVKDGMALLANHPGCRALWIPDTPDEPTIILSDGWTDFHAHPRFRIKNR